MILTTKKGMDRASSDVGLIFTVYKLRRIFNLVRPEMLKEYLRAILCRILAISDLDLLQKTGQYF
ncbi:hypothetical protein SAMN03080617_04027 [Algoriphagus alkaliphilus]|uniref:Transposase DDE domain-containing protein n=1 Tax=Algoriphagus alkaliphilus TaxID=279824 RepID=A0A1G5ZK76_9BACT|nr:hypothetical protein SAMN03080617_04027 [Algoriphagus alkaliphilus]